MPRFNLLKIFSCALVISLASCGGDSEPDESGDGGSDPSGTGAVAEGSFTVFVSKSGGGDRAEMSVTEATTFGQVRAFTASEFGIAEDGFRLMVAGKYPEDSATLGEHELKAPGGPAGLPAGNIIVRVNN